jgi:DNA-binding transcriptional ArsR family regulator
MSKVTLNRETFKALASDTRLDILRVLDGKPKSLKEISSATSLNKATLHEHLTKLNEVGLVKRKEREGHKWVYYKLTWKGESLLHPENTRIVVLFSVAFVALCTGIIQFILFVKGTFIMSVHGTNQYEEVYVLTQGKDVFGATEGGSDALMNGTRAFNITGPFSNLDPVPENAKLLFEPVNGGIDILYQNPLLLYIAVACFIIFGIISVVFLWRLWGNRKPKL